MTYNKKAKRKDAKEEVIYDVITNTRKQVIFLQLEVKFNKEYLEKNTDELTPEMIEKMNISIHNMEVEIEFLLSKLRFYKKERDMMIEKKIMKDYEKFPKTISMSQLQEVEL